jgi:hypothetical protein
MAVDRYPRLDAGDDVLLATAKVPGERVDS